MKNYLVIIISFTTFCGFSQSISKQVIGSSGLTQTTNQSQIAWILGGWWSLDGNINDESGNENNRSLSNEARCTTNRNENANSAIIFPGLLNLPLAEFNKNTN